MTEAAPSHRRRVGAMTALTPPLPRTAFGPALPVLLTATGLL